MIFTAFLWSATTLSVPKDAEAKRLVWKSKSGDAKLKFGFRSQVRLRSLGESDVVDGEEEGTQKVVGKDYDFDFRRLRLIVGGQISKLVKFAAQTDLSNKTGNAMVWRDAYITLDFADAFKASFGLFKVQFTRSRNGSGFGQMALDRPFAESTATNSSNNDGKIGGKRDQQLVLWGNAGKFQYRLGVGDGAATKGLESDTLRYTGRVHYAILDAEKGLGYKETYLGKKNILTIGAGIDSQENVHKSGQTGEITANTAQTVDITFEKTMGSGLLNLNGAYYARSLDDDTSSKQGTGYHVAAGFQFNSFMPYARYSTWDADPEAKDKSITNVGVSYLIKGHNAKIVFDVEMVAFEKEGSTKAKQDHTIATMQWQLDI